jgi:molybdenum cofactor synthesis domain-containing protein
MLEFDLLRKSELKFINIDLNGADLNAVAAAVANVLELTTEEVFVTDYLDRVMTLDILRDKLYPHQIIDKRTPLLERLAAVPGVTVSKETTIFSEGMLGWIAADAKQAAAAIEQAVKMSTELRERWAKRCIVFATGAELIDGQVKDTNSASIKDFLTAQGYSVAFGGTLRDDQDLIEGSIRTAIGNGYSIVITTGGVGAESKDRTVEAVLEIDPQAATPYICTFEKGKGRHVKDGIRIAVAEHESATIISLPGPNDEVCASLPLLLEGLDNRIDKGLFAERMAVNLRDRWRAKHDHHHLAH